MCMEQPYQTLLAPSPAFVQQYRYVLEDNILIVSLCTSLFGSPLTLVENLDGNLKYPVVMVRVGITFVILKSFTL